MARSVWWGSLHCFLALMLFVAATPSSAQSVAQGKALYINALTPNSGTAAGSSCASCHISDASSDTFPTASGASLGHRNASNNYTHILNAMNAGGAMEGYFNPVRSSAEAFSLALFIGQYKAPVFSVANGSPSLSMSVRSGATATRDVYPLLVSDGSGGVASDTGFTKTNGTNGTVNASQTGMSTSMQYNASYTSTAGFTGADSFSVTIANPSGSASRNIAVTVLGITSSATAIGFKGTTYTPGSPLYQITSNDVSASNFTAGGLPAGISIDSITGKLTGTPTVTGSFSVTLGATINGAINNGTVSKTLTLTIAGITSNNSASYTQNSAIATYQITTFPGAPSAYSLTGTLPPGLSFSSGSGQITGTPTASGNFSVILGATTSSGAVSQGLDITVASAGVPVVSTSPVMASNPTPNVVGTVGASISTITVNGTNPPLTPGSYAATGLPPGLSINPNTGVISGVPNTSGDYSATLRVGNASGDGSLTVVMRVHASGAPTINSPTTATGTVGTPGTQYTISTNGINGPIEVYSVTGTLPNGLGLNPATGAISGTPTASGVSTVTVGARNTGGQTGTLSVTFIIAPNAAPVISSPANGTTTALALGVAMTPISITATNTPLTSFALSSGTLPAGVTLNPVSGVISGTPTTPSASTAASFTATNAVGTSAPVTVNFSVGVPAPASCTSSTPVNTAILIDLKTCMFPALAPSGFTVSVQPAHGTLSISGTNATYSPASNFFGTDAFTAVAQFSGGASSSAGTVTVTVTGRPDPVQDRAVTAIIAAQIDTSQQIVRTQISNYGRHMEALVQKATQASNRSSGNRGVAFSSRSKTDPGVTLKSSNSLSQLDAVGTNSATQLPATNTAPSLPLSSAVNLAAGQLGLSQNPLYNLASDFVQSRSVNLAHLSMGLGEALPAGALPGPKVWAEGVVSFGVRDANGTVSAADFNSKGISVGVDHVLSDKLTVGMGIGYAQDTTNIGTDGTRNQARGYSLAVYGNYMTGERGYVQGMLGVGALDFDMNRYVSAANAYAVSSRKGYQLFGSVGTGLEFRDKANMISPYLRLDFSTDKLGENTETGAGSYSLTYYDQTNSALQGTLGLRGESTHATPFGWAIPRARVEWRQDLSNKSEASMSYADQLNGTRYAIASSGSQRGALVLGVGSEFIFRDGWALGLDYQLTQVSNYESSYALRFKLIKELGAKGLPNLLEGIDQEFDDGNEIQVDAGYAWDDNITRAKLNSDIRGDSIYTFNASQTRMFFLGGNTRMLLTGAAGGERFQTYNGLSNLNLTGEAALQYRADAEFDTPTYGLFFKATAIKHQSSLRDGYKYAVGLTASRPLTDRITLFGALTNNRRSANSAVFQTVDTALRFNLDYSLRNNATVYLSGEYREGDIVSTGLSSLENITLAKVLVQDDAYSGGKFFSYRFGGSTVLATLGYNLGLGARDSMDFAWRYVESTPTLRPAWATSPRSYTTNQLSASYLMRF